MQPLKSTKAWPHRGHFNVRIFSTMCMRACSICVASAACCACCCNFFRSSSRRLSNSCCIFLLFSVSRSASSFVFRASKVAGVACRATTWPGNGLLQPGTGQCTCPSNDGLPTSATTCASKHVLQRKWPLIGAQSSPSSIVKSSKQMEHWTCLAVRRTCSSCLFTSTGFARSALTCAISASSEARFAASALASERISSSRFSMSAAANCRCSARCCAMRSSAACSCRACSARRA
mmetsp:Transcript_53246/g.105891  ORF Transcript_53246/g.105891 Transcript_53246/m.105891 type:complete len:234 (-) Transcript_53246:496-1197(-)